MLRILLIDIETAPNLVHVWGLWNQNVSINQIQTAGYVLCWSAKWLNEDEVMFSSIMNGEKAMLRKIHKLLDQADAVVHYNGSKFDIPTLNKEFLIHGLQPPAPYKEIDLLKTVRQRFKFPSRKLDYVAQQLKVGRKYRHQGHDLWSRCMVKDKQAWGEMEAYNKQDVLLLEKVYSALVPWIKDHANHSLYEDGLCCPNCGQAHFQRRGFAYTKTQKYVRYQCTDCGNWFRGGRTQALGPEEKMVNL